MEVWGWILLYAFGLTLLQLLLYRYLSNEENTIAESGRRLGDDRSEPELDGRNGRRDPRVEHFSPPDTAVGSSGDGGRICPHCGAENGPEQTFTRCWNCTGSL